MAFTSFALD